ncbi:YhgE/Pip domain-containing protein [Paeniglutamicibacter cryotolerans]|uniref:Putative membrane protein n=1 Tax=Paeniglutamicibacter cryotolerans TaxID=670079 RepID=A0A839QI70_9MICC|nr:YhgE/Pip domain-containing protein [Paeniglutamicibacter cryotolerans]MBB2995313.1 putative membrane protein [Paeniglutamicibacter cryotolerans]
MTTLRLALSELKRMTSGTLPRLAIIAMALVPLLYGSLYLYANWDPYSHLNNVKAAIVNLDEGSTLEGKDLKVGDDVVESLMEDGTFGWVATDSEAAAANGVSAGDYAFALTIPRDFSANLASPADFDAAKQAILKLTTNDANNYMVGTFADKLADKVHDTVAREVGTQTADALLTGFGRIHAEMTKAADGASDLHQGTIKLSDGIGTLADGAKKLDSGARDLSEGAHTLAGGTSELVTGQGKLLTGAQKLAVGADKLDTGATQLDNGLATLKAKTAQLPDKTRQLSDGAAAAAKASGQLSQGAKAVADGNKELSDKVGTAAATITQLEADADKRLNTALADLKASGITDPETFDALAARIRTSLQTQAHASGLDAQAKTAKADLKGAQEKIDALAAGSRKVADGAAALDSGLGTLATGTDTLADSMPALVSGISGAASGADALAAGAGDLHTGAATLASGQKDALAGAKKLDVGAGKLAGGTDSLAGGTDSLLDGTGTLSTGAGELKDGAGELATGLDDGTSEVPNPNDSQRESASNVIGDPVSIERTDQAKAGTYGEGLAPFFMTLAIWIGAFILIQIMRPITKRALASNAASWKIAVGGWLPFLLLSILQATVLYSVVLWWLGLDPAHPWMTWGLFLLASMAFTAIIQGVCALLGTPGKMVVLVLMVLQLVSAGGTFPWETIPGPLQIAHRWLPMGHVVTGLRHLMYGADLGVLVPIVAALIGYTVLGLAASTIAVRRHKTWTIKTLQPELSA